MPLTERIHSSDAAPHPDSLACSEHAALTPSSAVPRIPLRVQRLFSSSYSGD